MRSIEIPQPKDRDWRYRAFEILPGGLALLILVSPLTLSLISTKLAAYFIIAYLLTWFIFILGVDYRAILGWRIINQHKKLPWLKLIDDLEILIPKTKDAPRWHARNLARVKRNIAHNRILPSEIYHVVIIAIWNEPKEILESTVKAVMASDYDLSKVIVIIAYEDRGGPQAEITATQVIKNLGANFYHALAVKHTDLPGEIIGKGGNVTKAARELKIYLDQQKIDPMNVLVTTLDVDTRPHPQYLGALTYTYCSTEEPRFASYQPVPMFLNNIWDAPAPMRVVATGNSFWNVMLSTRPHMLRNFSSHAQPMASLIDTDYWSVRTVVEDGHQFWRTYFRYNGRHDVFPLHIPVYQDAVLTDNYKKTLKAQFYQVRRWSYGASDIAYFANQAFLKTNNIPLHKLIGKFSRLIINHVSWSTMPLVLLLSAYPPLFLNPQSYAANQLPQVASKLQMVAMAGILASLFVSFMSLPPKPARYKKHRTLWLVLQWAYLPLVTIVYGSFAAINSQVRLAFGWYLGKFDLTEKAIRSKRTDVV